MSTSLLGLIASNFVICMRQPANFAIPPSTEVLNLWSTQMKSWQCYSRAFALLNSSSALLASLSNPLILYVTIPVQISSHFLSKGGNVRPVVPGLGSLAMFRRNSRKEP